MFVTYLLHSYLLDPHNVNMPMCITAFETSIADIELSTHIPLNWIPWRNILNLNTFDNLRVIYLLKLEMYFQVSTIINYFTEFSTSVLTKINY